MSRRGSLKRNDAPGSKVEQGVIRSLKESFGFILCADRANEIFFHFSEVKNCSPDSLQIDTEVQFRVGTSERDDTKLAAFEVSTLPSGTIVWEIEEEPGKVYLGLVDRSVRKDPSRSGGIIGASEGIIRVVPDPLSLDDDDDDDEDGIGLVVRYRAEDFRPSEYSLSKSSGGNSPSSLFRGDLVQFRIVTNRRTKHLYARHIKLLQTEKDRSRVEREQKLMQTAVVEQGIVVALHKGYGFLKSAQRRDHVYFHYSHVVLPPDGTWQDFELKKGQEMRFLVVTESDDDTKPPKCSARQLNCLPKGTVVFHKVVQKGVRGIVTTCPHPPAQGGKESDSKDGMIRLIDSVASPDGGSPILDVAIQFEDVPGGVYTYQHRGGTASGLWIQEGDTLLFDVVKQISDGRFRAAPTQHTLGPGGTVKEPNGKSGSEAVRLTMLNLAGRAEGILHTLKGSAGYGFIQYAERLTDVHFNTYNVLPDDIQSDLRKQMGLDPAPVRMEAGVSVHFDICAHGTVSSSNSRGRRPNERENVKAHRVLLLPRDTVKTEIMIATGASGVVKTADSKQPYAGFLDLDDEMTQMTEKDHHPLIDQLIESFYEESGKPHGRKSLVYRDTLSLKDDAVVTEMVKTKYGGLLECDHIPVPGIEPHPGRLVIRRVTEPAETKQEEDDKAGKKKETKPQKNIRFDKSCLSPEMREEIPPGVGDLVVCDIFQSRRTGKLMIQNLKITKRQEREDDGEVLVASERSGLGVVRDVVQNRNFGFISVLDENATRREVLFFNLAPPGKQGKKPGFKKGDEVKFSIKTEKGGKRTARNVEVLPKGTIPSKEAKNACRGYILMEPSHTSLGDTPVRKSLGGSNSKLSSGRWGNAKEELGRSSHHESIEAGVILLLEDKAGMFSKKAKKATKSKAGTDGTKDDDDAKSVETEGTPEDEQNSADEARGMEDSKNFDMSTTSFDDILEDENGTGRLRYKAGGIAIHGTGSSCAMDSSTLPRRGDLVSFVKFKKGKGVRDIRVVTRNAATLIRGRLEKIELAPSSSPGSNAGKAKFIAATEKAEEYDVNLAEVVSCDAAVLKEMQTVEGILHDGKIFGICRTTDLYLDSKLGSSHKERPKLNLTVKKNRGGTIMAQSMMAKGPDGTKGFVSGWTKRKSVFDAQ